MNKKIMEMDINTTINQLGGTKAIVMTGCKFFAGADSLCVKFPKLTPKNRISYIMISLNGNDYYDLKFCRHDSTTKIIETDIEASMLKSIIEDNTGLYLSL